MPKPILKFIAGSAILSVFVISLSLILPGGKAEYLSSPEKKTTSTSSSSTATFSLEASYKQMAELQANLSQAMEQPNILKEDILRGWYLSSEENKKYGTPEDWVFVEDQSESKWMSPFLLEEADTLTDRMLCKLTAGQYTPSCLESSEVTCHYEVENTCQCSEGTAWKAGEGCILLGKRGGFMAINSTELEQGFYLGLPNQKKLNTPPGWSWKEEGKNSAWRRD